MIAESFLLRAAVNAIVESLDVGVAT